MKHSPERRNYLLGIANGVATQLGMNVTNPGLVLSVFVRALGGSNALIGVLPAVRFGGWMLPQFLLAGWVQAQRREVPVVVRLEILRGLAYGAMAALTLALGRSHPGVLLAAFMMLFTFTRLTASLSGLTRLDLIGKVIPPQRRGSFFAMRSFWGGVLVFGVGFLVRHMLDPDRGQPFPLNFSLLFGLSACSFVASAFVFAGTREGPNGARPRIPSLKTQLRLAPALIKRNPRFRQYLVARVLLYMTRLVDPFYPIFALDVLGAPASMVGLYLSAMTLARVLANLLWQRTERVRGPHFLIKASSFLTLLTPLLAVVLPALMRLTGFTVESHGLLPAYFFTAVFLLAGAGNSGRGISLNTLLLDTAPEEERASHIGLVNTVLGVVSFLPILSGAVIDRLGFEVVFVAATALLLFGFLVTLRLQPRAPNALVPVASELDRRGP